MLAVVNIWLLWKYCSLASLPWAPSPPVSSLHILNFMPDLTGLCKWLRLILGQGQIAQPDVFVLGFHASLPSLWLDLASYNGFNQTNLKTDTCFVCNDEPDSHIIGCRVKIFRNSETVWFSSVLRRTVWVPPSPKIGILVSPASRCIECRLAATSDCRLCWFMGWLLTPGWGLLTPDCCLRVAGSRCWAATKVSHCSTRLNLLSDQKLSICCLDFLICAHNCRKRPCIISYCCSYLRICANIAIVFLIDLLGTGR